METTHLLKTVPRDKAFYFFLSIGNYTGQSATSLKEFMEKLNEVNAKSLDFHVNRGDFEKWVSDVLEDQDLAQEIKRLQKSNLTGETLRTQLSAAVSRRLRRVSGQASATRL
jgi:alpha-amylase